MSVCHPDKPEEAKGLCNRCYKRKWANDNAAKIKKQAAQNKEKYPQATCHPNKKSLRAEGGICRSCHGLEKYHKNPLLGRDAYLRRSYGISLVQYETQLASQNGVCAICRELPVQRRKTDRQPSLHVDHDHTTGEFRGLLCFGCNVALGALKDDPALFERSALYLKGALNDSK